MRNILAIITLSLCFVGCNPHLQPATVSVPERYIYATSSDSITISSEWWTMFRDTTLNRLVNQALEANQNIAAAAARIEQAKANLKVARAAFLPNFTLGRSAGISGNGSIKQQYIVEPAVSWEIPLFGSLRATTAQASAEVEYAKWQYSGVQLALSAEVATTYFTLLQYRTNLDIAIESSRLRKETATLTDSLFVRGMASGVNREQALNLLYTSQADIPNYERAVRQTLLSLDILLGKTPDSTAYITTSARLIDDYIPFDIPAGVPSDILYRRPDVISSYMNVLSAAASAKLARIARFPTFTLTGDGGFISDDITELFTAGSVNWSALLSMTQPLYNFKGLKAREQSAVEAYNEAVANYRQSFLEAVKDVESALVSISAYREQTARYKELVRSNAKIAMMTSALYDNGLTAYLDVIDAQRNLYNSRLQYSNIVAQQYINYINLCKALGGGFKP